MGFIKNSIVRLIKRDSKIAKDTFSQNCLSPLMDNYPYLAYSTSSIDYHSLHILMNDIIINGRTSIIEFGSGTSTLLIGRLLKKNNIQGSLVSVESDESWTSLMQKKIQTEGLSEYIKFVYAP